MFSEALASDEILKQGTAIAAQWDAFYAFLIWISIFFFVLIVGLMILFAIKYRSRPGRRAKYIHGNLFLEVTWTLIPTILLLIIFGWGYQVYHNMVNAPSGAYEIRVIGKQWLWQFQYDHGYVGVGDLYVPANRPVKLLMTSDDVLHSFFVPDFRIKQDVVPGRYTTVWFEAQSPGEYTIYCAEYCGAAHSGMLGKVIALDDENWNLWLRGRKIQIPGGKTPSGNDGNLKRVNLVDLGKKVMQAKGCIACHTDDGRRMVGPSYKGIYGKMEEMADGSKVKVDENYLRESIENPNAKVVKGYPPTMPAFKGLLTEEEMNAVIAYIKSLK